MQDLRLACRSLGDGTLDQRLGEGNAVFRRDIEYFQDFVCGMAVQATLEEILWVERFQNIDAVEHGIPCYYRQHHMHDVATRI